MLLDTHVCLWLIGHPERLGARARQQISSAAAVFVSSVSVAEVETKRMTGGLDVPADFLGLLTASGVAPLALTCEHAGHLASMPELARHDPFDRLLMAQAAADGMPFLTADRVLLALGVDDVLDARE